MDSTEPTIIVTAFEDQHSAANALKELHKAHFRKNQYSLEEAGGSPTALRTKLISHGVPEEDAQYYTQQYDEGHPILTLHFARNETGLHQSALDILRRNNSYRVPDQQSNPNSVSYQSEPGAKSQTSSSPEDETKRLQLREEALQVNKEWVTAGEVIVRKRIVTEEKTVTVSVSREELTIERRPLDPKTRQDENAEAAGGQENSGLDKSSRILELAEGEVFRILLHEEQINVTKTPVVREEVIMGKRIVQENRKIRDTIKRELPTVNQQGDVSIQMPQENA